MPEWMVTCAQAHVRGHRRQSCALETRMPEAEPHQGFVGRYYRAPDPTSGANGGRSTNAETSEDRTSRAKTGCSIQ